MVGEEKRMEKRVEMEVAAEHYDLEILLRRPSLRAGLPRRVSQARRDTVQTHDATCGFWCVRGDWLQSFANRTTYLFVYGVLGCFYGAYYAYFSGIVTTLEKRFQISSQTIGLIAAVSDMLLLVMSFILSFFTSKFHKTKWTGVGIIMIILSAIISSLPHFLYGAGEDLERETTNSTTKTHAFFQSTQELCSKDSRTCTISNDEKIKTITLLIIAQSLHGLGGSLYIILGKSYRDDNLQNYQPPAVISLVVMLKALGPAFGFWLASVCLKIFVSPSKIPNTSESDPLWIGAWWLGNLLIGFMLLIPGTFIFLFPINLPKTAIKRMFSVKKTIPTQNKTINLACLSLNPTFNKYNFSGLFNTAGFLGYFLFLPKYVEIQYQLLPSEANFITGTMALICCAVGIIFGNSVVTRYRPTVKAIAGWNIFVGCLSICAITSFMYLACTNQDLQIQELVTQMFQLSHNSSIDFAPICNGFGETKPSVCDCSTIAYKNNVKVYEKCKFEVEVKEAFPGVCPVDCHFPFLIFMIVTCCMSFLYASGRSSSFWFEMKHCKLQQSPLHIVGVALLSFLAFVPAPILFGYILDTACLIWNGSCFEKGNCWLYDNERLRFHINLTAIGFAIVGIVSDVGFLYCVRDLQLFMNPNSNEYSEN